MFVMSIFYARNLETMRLCSYAFTASPSPPKMACAFPPPYHHPRRACLQDLTFSFFTLLLLTLGGGGAHCCTAMASASGLAVGLMINYGVGQQFDFNADVFFYVVLPPIIFHQVLLLCRYL